MGGVAEGETDTSGVDSSEEVAGVAVVSVVEDSDCPSAGGSRRLGYFGGFKVRLESGVIPSSRDRHRI